MSKTINNKDEIYVLTIYDKITEKHSVPMFFTNKKAAGRYFLDLVSPNANKNHFSFYFIGIYDNFTGIIKPIEPRVVIDGGVVIDLDFSFEVL